MVKSIDNSIGLTSKALPQIDVDPFLKVKSCPNWRAGGGRAMPKRQMTMVVMAAMTMRGSVMAWR